MPKPFVNLPGEIWKPVVGWEGFYEVSNMGRVASVTSRWRTTRLRTPIRHRKGYQILQLNARGVVSTAIKVHKLVLEAFVGPRPPGMQCCHNNGKPDDNRLCNLRWDTAKANAADKHKHGTAHGPTGSAAGNAKLNERQVARIKRRLLAGERGAHIARDYGVAKQTIYDIASARRWRHVPWPQGVI